VTRDAVSAVKDASDDAVTDSAFLRAKQTVTVTIEFCNWLSAKRSVAFDQVTQAHIELWQSTGPTTLRQGVLGVFSWAGRRGIGSRHVELSGVSPIWACIELKPPPRPEPRSWPPSAMPTFHLPRHIMRDALEYWSRPAAPHLPPFWLVFDAYLGPLVPLR
jgi:hypothetical protein